MLVKEKKLEMPGGSRARKKEAIARKWNHRRLKTRLMISRNGRTERKRDGWTHGRKGRWR